MPKQSESVQHVTEKALLVFINSDEGEDQYVEEELTGLCEAAKVEVCGMIRQRVDRPTSKFYLGSGKVDEIANHVVDAQADVVIFDCDLSAIQSRNLATVIKRPIIDRTQLILDIFAGRARTSEGQLQVELAQLSYLMPRLMSFYTKFERQKGGIGMRGPGETKLEADRRLIRERISRLENELEDVRRQRVDQRKARRKNPFPFASIVGYTSAGKSTLMNRLSGTDLLADAMPFATLDPTTRKMELPDGYSVFLTDTVGFIRKLPTTLVAAFRSTLEEVTGADIVLHLIDASHPEWDIQRDAVMDTLEVLKAQDKPMLTIFNKVDQLPYGTDLDEMLSQFPNSVAISALNGEGIPELLAMLKEMVQQYLGYIVALVPYEQSRLVSDCYRFGRVLRADYRDEGILVEAELVAEMRGVMSAYQVDPAMLQT